MKEQAKRYKRKNISQFSFEAICCIVFIGERAMFFPFSDQINET